MKSDPQLIADIYNAFDPFKPLQAGDPAYVECGKVRGDSNVEQDLAIVLNVKSCSVIFLIQARVKKVFSVRAI